MLVEQLVVQPLRKALIGTEFFKEAPLLACSEVTVHTGNPHRQALRY